MPRAKHLVLDEVVERLVGVTTANGYWLDAGGRVFTRMVLPEESDVALPYFCVVLAQEDETFPSIEQNRVESTWAFEVWAFVGERLDDARITSTAIDACKARDDIVRALMQDWTLGKSCADSKPVSCSSVAGTGGQPDYGEVILRWQVYQIEQREDMGPQGV